MIELRDSCVAYDCSTTELHAQLLLILNSFKNQYSEHLLIGKSCKSVFKIYVKLLNFNIRAVKLVLIIFKKLFKNYLLFKILNKF